MLLKDKTAVITGCNRGIGAAMLEVFATHGASVFACARAESKEFSTRIEQISDRTNTTITPFYFDLAHADQVKDVARQIISTKEKIDVLVNNVGIASGELFQMASVQNMKNVFEVNFFSTLLLTQPLARYMGRFQAGSIINIASVVGIIGEVGTVAYGSSKAALIHATKTMATELGEKNIRVNAIAPGITKTGMFDQMDPSAREKLMSSSSLKRPAEAHEIAHVALFLASDLSSYMTGQVLRVDGGII